MPTIYIIRGLPGSGKTSLAERLVSAWSHMCAADDYFYRLGEGDYAFDPSLLKEAHAECQDRIKNLMKCGVEAIAVHNTFSQKWEAAPYFKFAEQFGYTTAVVECQSKFNNIHKVPQESIMRMGERWEPLLD